MDGMGKGIGKGKSGMCPMGKDDDDRGSMPKGRGQIPGKKSPMAKATTKKSTKSSKK